MSRPDCRPSVRGLREVVTALATRRMFETFRSCLRHPSTSSDVERFGMTLEGFVPTASWFNQIDSIALTAIHARSPRRIRLPRSTLSTAPFGAALSAAHSSSSPTPGTTNRRSTWAGVSWPNENANKSSELDVLRLINRQLATAATDALAARGASRTSDRHHRPGTRRSGTCFA
jgi:hypothetical protein